MRSKKQLKKSLKECIVATPFVLPGLLLVIVFMICPIFFSLRISMSDYQIVQGTMSFVGLKNFISLLTDPQTRFFYAFRNNLLYAVVTIPFILFIGLLLAYLINNLTKGRLLFRIGFYLPVITSWVIVGLVFVYLFNSNQRGLINYILVDKLHILKNYVSWLQYEWTGNIAIWTMGIWKNIGWAMVIYLAALQGIHKDLYEAASIDGASGARKFFYITMPLVKPTTFFILVNMLIGSFNVFLQVMLLTQGQPSGKTSVLQYLLYDRAFNLFQFGEGAAIGILTGITVFILTMVLNRLLKLSER